MLDFMGLLGVSWFCYLWRYFSWEYGGVYLCCYDCWVLSCCSKNDCWVLWSHTCYGEAQKLGLTNVWLECDFALVCVAFTVTINVPWMFRNQWNICFNYCGKIRFRVTHIFREKKMHVRINWLIYYLFIYNHFIGIISFHLICS